jgi:hypothetical protein
MEIEPMLDALTDPTFYRVVIDFNWLQGSFGLGGFYYLPDEPGQPDVWLNLDATFVPPSGATVTLLGETSLISVSTPCALSGGSAIVLTVPVADVDVDMMGLATSTADTATFDGLEVETVTDTDGYDWLCPVDAGGAPALLGPRLLPPPMPQPRLPRRDPQLATR